MIALVIGTNRPGAASAQVAAQVKEIYAAAGQDPQVLDLADLPPEIFDPSSYATKPEAFNRFSDTVLASKGIVWVTPEYNGSLPGVAKYFIDMLPFPESFEHRPVTFIGVSAGMWGALRPIEQLEAIFKYRQGLVFAHRVHLMPIGNLLDDNGRLTDPKAVERIEAQAKGFLEFVAQVKGGL
ncbi:MAG: NAD(P)H-dependent oxidoreductase [Verrucomicrobiota bacterium]